MACLLVFSTAAASNQPAWFTQVWKSDDGLPNNYVTGLAQTPDGYLWVATYSSPARFDGVRFEEHLPKDFADGINHKITALELNGGGGLWMGTLHGQVLLLDSKSVKVFADGLPYKQVQTMTEDREGSLWITYQGGAVSRIKNGKVRTFTADDGLPTATKREQYVCSMTSDTDGRIWFAKNGRVGVVRGDRFETLLELRPTTARLARSAAGGIWICLGARLMKYGADGELQDRGAFEPKQVGTEPTALLEDREGGIWIGTSASGLFRYDGVVFESVPTSDQRITSLAEDRRGNIWVGTSSGGLNRIRPRVVALETVETGLPFNVVQSLCEDASGTVWATTHNGLLICRSDGEWRAVSADSNWPGGRASSVASDGAGSVWIGTKDRALHRWRHGRFSSWWPEDGLASREIHALLVSKKGDVWIGQTGPDVVQRLRGKRLKTFEMPPDVRVIRAMVEDARGDIWVGTSKGMLVRISGDTVTDETGRTTGKPLSIRCLHTTPDGSLWIGYADEGLGRLKDGRFSHLTSACGLPENNISQIISDEQGWLWFAGDHGIFKARQRTLEALAEGRAAKAHYIRYGQSEGLFSMEANCGDSPGTLRSRDGRLWLPMRTALAVIHPDRLFEDLEPPVMLLRRVAVDDETLALYGGVVPVRQGLDLNDAGGALRLPPGHHRIDFEFTALSFGAPENVRFRYRLEGYDDHWIDGGAQRSASFSRLAHGSYRFHVQACNSDGIWNERGAALAFVVSPFLWQTWWFRLAGLAIFTSVTAAIVRSVSLRRVRRKLRLLEQQTALDRERARIARDIHDDLGSRLTEVELLIDQAQRAPVKSPDGNMRQISSTVRQVGESLDEIVWAINPRHDTLPHLINYLGRYAIEFLETAGVRCRVDLPDEPPDHAVLPEVRHNLFLAAKEALNNVARHARASEAWLRVSLAGGLLSVAIEDNGTGFRGDAGDVCADGLRNMRQRMEAVGGRLRIEAPASGGTHVLLTLPWPPKLKRNAGGRTPNND